MRQHSSGFVIGIVAAIILGFGFLILIWWGLGSISDLGSESGVIRATKTGPNSATLQLSTYPDAHVCHSDSGEPQIDWVSYCSGDNGLATQLELPPNSVITVIIRQYDSGTTLVNNYFGQVRGTIGGVASLDGQPYSNMSQVSQIAKTVKGHTFSSDPGHTFTIQSTPNSPYPIFVSVPLVGVSDDAPNNVTINGNQYPTPNIIEFQFKTGPAGLTYLWHCYVPCGNDRGQPYGFSGPMWTLGYMAGMVHVTNY
ncbi:MAG TPA: hypothetical protein VKV40_14135 [Ktedonobacteraceae bacterium]|nr:hypothetical protein [Ktedonobacteraceae bacterium]